MAHRCAISLCRKSATSAADGIAHQVGDLRAGAVFDRGAAGVVHDDRLDLADVVTATVGRDHDGVDEILGAARLGHQHWQAGA
jgi:hypothetical protein